MADVNTTTGVGADTTANTDTGVNNTSATNTDTTQVNNNDNNVALPTSIEELQKLLQSEGDKRVNQARTKIEQDYKTRIETEKAEAERVAKLTAQEREKEILEKNKKELQLKEFELKSKELELKTIDILKEKELSLDFKKFVLAGANSEEDVQANIEEFNKMFVQKVQEEIDKRIIGTAPRKRTEGDSLGGSNDFLSILNQNKIR